MYCSDINDELQMWHMHHVGIFLQHFQDRLPRELRDLVYTKIAPSGYIYVGYRKKNLSSWYVTDGEELKHMQKIPIYDPRQLVPNVSKEMAEHLYSVLEFRIPDLHVLQGLLSTDIFLQHPRLGQLIRTVKINVRFRKSRYIFGFDDKEDREILASIKNRDIQIEFSIHTEVKRVRLNAMKELAGTLKPLWDYMKELSFTNMGVWHYPRLWNGNLFTGRREDFSTVLNGPEEEMALRLEEQCSILLQSDYFE